MLVSIYVTLHLASIEQAWKAADRDRRRHRHGAAAPLVLVADQRLVGSVGDGGRRSGVAVPADRAGMGRRSGRATSPT
jgi:hypothetical protein